MGYLQLDKIEVGAGGASSVTFSNLPNEPGDLEVYLSIKGNVADDQLLISTNETGSYRARGFTVQNSTISTIADSSLFWRVVDMVADTTNHPNSFSIFRLILWNYSTNQRANGFIQGSQMEKGGATSTVEVMPALTLTTQNSNSITELTFDLLSGTIQEGSTFTRFHLTH